MNSRIETRVDRADNDNAPTPEGGGPMRIYIFKSDANKELRAFAGDSAGSKLPAHFRPWHAVGVITPERAPPHNFARPAIEKAINEQGFQLWRMKPKTP
jgi:hypothetical protein